MANPSVTHAAGMKITHSQQSDLLDMMERLQDQVLALRAISGLLCGCSTPDSVEPSELTYLLDPIIEREKELIDEAMDLIRLPQVVVSHSLGD